MVQILNALRRQLNSLNEVPVNIYITALKIYLGLPTFRKEKHVITDFFVTWTASLKTFLQLFGPQNWWTGKSYRGFKVFKTCFDCKIWYVMFLGINFFKGFEFC